MKALRQLFQNLNPYIDAVLDFIYPPYCIICTCRLESSSKLICESCWQNLPRTDEHTREGNLKLTNNLKCISVWEYNNDVQKVIHEMKYFKKRSLASLIGDEMARLVSNKKEYLSADFIIPVPLHKTKLRERGYNQSLLLAEKIADLLNIPCESHNLKRIRYTKSQSQLNAREREKNVEAAFQVMEPDLLEDKAVILVDDVLTTGATLMACTHPLMKAATANILAVTAAKA